MAAEKGSAFLLKVGDGGSPPVYATVAGMRTTQMSVNGEAVNVTSKESQGWRELLSGAGVRSVSVAASGIFTGSAAETRIKANALAGLLDDYELSFESGERLRGRFLLTRLDYAGDHNGERTYGVALAPAGSALFDDRFSLDVELANAGMWLEGRDNDALIGGANAALAGDEIIQFGAAMPLGANRFRLSRLLRGRRGTEWAAGAHEAGERFILLDPAGLAAIEAPAGSVGGEARLLPAGIGDLPGAAAASVAIEGTSLQPPSPVHLRAAEMADGGLLIQWVHRSRQGWAWLSGSDTPLGEELERYRLEIAGAGFARIINADAPFYLYSAVERAADGATAPLQISVSQIGTFAQSRPAQILPS